MSTTEFGGTPPAANASGFCRITVSRGCVLLTLWTAGCSFASCRIVNASLSDLPSTSGTSTRSGLYR